MVESEEPPKEEDVMPSSGEVYGDWSKDPEKEESQPQKSDNKDENVEDEEDEKAKQSTPSKDAIEGKKRDYAFVKNQAEKYPHTVSPGDMQVFVLDMVNDDDRKEYGRIKTEDQNEDSGLTMVFEDIQFSQQSNNWKAMIVVHNFKFSPIQ